MRSNTLTRVSNNPGAVHPSPRFVPWVSRLKSELCDLRM